MTAKNSSRDFTRSGTLSPELMIVLMLYLVADAGRRGYGNLLDAFWDECGSLGVPLPVEEPVSAVAFCKARKKLKSPLFRHLVHQVADDFEETHGSRHRWNGMRVLACDGSKISLQRAEQLLEDFGGPTNGHCPQMLVSTLYDVIAGVPVDVSVAPFASCERSELLAMLDQVKPGNLLILDRGCPSHELLRELVERGIHFLIRLPINNTFKAVESFIMNGGSDQIVEIDPPKNAPADAGALRLRAVHRKRDNSDECLVFLTDLRRNDASAREIEELYRLRWPVEELYKIEKGSYLGQGQFHAKNVDGVRQEVYTFALFIAISRGLMASAAESHDVVFDDLSQKAALLAVSAYITRLCIQPHRSAVIDAIGRLIARIARNLDPPRPGRSFPRRSFKPHPRWGATGRRWSSSIEG